MNTLTLTITGMSCGHCLNAVNRALANLRGVEVREVQMGRAELGYDPAVTNSRDVIAAVEGAGYEVAGSREDGPVA